MHWESQIGRMIVDQPVKMGKWPCTPHRLHNAIQHYSWGTRDAEAFIPRLLGIPAEPGLHYAELWLGTHPNAPSNVIRAGERLSLTDLIAQDPAGILGAEVAQRFEGQLPFLFKVLSAAEPLSIQAHPDKAQARRLHALDPQHYPDANHKPEIAIALDRLTAVMGLKSPEDLRATLCRYPEIAAFTGENHATPQQCFAALVRRSLTDSGALQHASQRLAARLEDTGGASTEIESLFLTLRQAYGDGDVGLFALFLLNFIELNAGEGLYVPAGTPHAYLRGNIVECMASSDNVVRIGLTPKFRDAEALLGMLAPDSGYPTILHAEPEAPEMVYPTPAEEFELRRLDLEPGAHHIMVTRGSVEIYLLVAGRVQIRGGGEEAHYDRGGSFLIPACLGTWQLTALEKTTLFKAIVPG